VLAAVLRMCPSNTTPPTILVTGGCGFIGSHTIVCLLNAAEQYNVVVVDNLVNSSSVSLDRVAEITKLTDEARKERLVFHKVDMRNEADMKKGFESSPKFTACIHFAGLKVRNPLNIHRCQELFSKKNEFYFRLLVKVRAFLFYTMIIILLVHLYCFN